MRPIISFAILFVLFISSNSFCEILYAEGEGTDYPTLLSSENGGQKLKESIKNTKGISSEVIKRSDAYGNIQYLSISKSSEGSLFIPLFQGTLLDKLGMLSSIERYDLQVDYYFSPQDKSNSGLEIYWGYRDNKNYASLSLSKTKYRIYTIANNDVHEIHPWGDYRFTNFNLTHEAVNAHGISRKDFIDSKFSLDEFKKVEVQIQRLGIRFQLREPYRKKSGDEKWEGILIRVNGKIVDVVKASELPEHLNEYGVKFHGKGRVSIHSVKVNVPPPIASIESGNKALAQGDFKKALSHFRPLALEANDPVAQLRLGALYLNGAGVEKDLVAANNWLKRASEAGLVEAKIVRAEALAWGSPEMRDYAMAKKLFLEVAGQKSAYQREAEYRLGRMYAEGTGVKADYTKAREWLERATEGMPQPQALYALGMMHGRGLGVPQDINKALELFIRGAEYGDLQSMMTLGAMYAKGEGVPVDYTESLKWFLILGSKLPPGDQKNSVQNNMQQIKARMTPTDIQKAEEAAGSWIKAH